MSEHLLLGLLLRQASAINMGTLRFIPVQQSFLEHDLHYFQDSRVARLLLGIDLFPNPADRARALTPQDAQDAQLSLCRLGQFGLFHHASKIIRNYS